jgi:AraC-like DNA-binding protein
MKYFLLVFSVFNGLLIVIIQLVPFVHIRKLVKPFLIIKLLMFAPLAISLLVSGIEATLLWFIAVPLFVYTISPDKEVIRWLLWYSCLVVVILGLGLALRYFLYDNIPVVEKKNFVWANILNIFAIFLFTTYSIYYINLFYRQRVNHLEYLAGLKNDEKIQDLHEADYDEQYKFRKIYEKIIEYIESTHPYIDSNFKIAKISNDLNINTMYISKAISLQKNTNFNNFINSYRIEHAKKMIQNNLEYTLEHIYLSSGFKNQSSFNRTFRTLAGITPSEYRSQFVEREKRA